MFAPVLLVIPLMATPEAPQQGPALETVDVFLPWGRNPGASGAVVDGPGGVEWVVAVSFGQAALYWAKMAYDAGSGEYRPTYVSPPVDGLTWLAVGDVDAASPGQEVVLCAVPSGTSTPTVSVWSLDTGERLRSFAAGPSGASRVVTGDLDGDGVAEIVLSTYGHTQVWSGSGGLVSDFPGFGHPSVLVGQMDGDPGLEIASAEVKVLDAASGVVQCSWSVWGADKLRTADLDGDGQLEFIYVESTNVWAYDPGLCLPMWSLSSGSLRDVELFDLDQDGVVELLVADGSELRAFDISTRNLLWTQQFAGGAIDLNRLFAGDADGDGVVELLCTSDGPSAGEDRLRVIDWSTGAIEWESFPYDAPLVGTARGDVDGDGTADWVIACSSTYDGYQAGRVLLLDDRMRVTRASTPVAWGTAHSVHDLALADLDGQPGPEVVLATNSSSDGVLVGYGMSGGDLTEVWNSSPFAPFQSFTTVDVLDLDGDGVPEVLGGTSRAGSSSTAPYVYAYDRLTGVQKWRSVSLGGSKVMDVECADFDGDGSMEVVAVLDTGDAWILDGVTGFVEGFLPGSWTSAGQYPGPGGLAYLLLGDSSGYLRAHTYQAFSYPLVASFPVVIGGPIDAMRLAAGGLFVSSEGRLQVHFQPLNGIPTLGTGFEGPGFGRWFQLVDPRNLVANCGFALRWLNRP